MSDWEFDYFPFMDEGEIQAIEAEFSAAYESITDPFAEDYTKEPIRSVATAEELNRRPATTLRGYQEEAVQGVFAEWDKGNHHTLVVHPTGSGKTFVIAAVTKRYQDRYGPRRDGSRRRGLILAHRDYLLNQIANALAAFNVSSAMEIGDQRARESPLFDDPDCVVASVQSMQSNGKTQRLLTWPTNYFDYIITDEGHHATAVTYRNIYKHFDAEHHLYVTATPDRMDGDNLGLVCDSVAHEYPMRDAVKAGWLCRLRVRWCDTKVDISRIRTTCGDLNEADIIRAITPHINTLANATVKELKDMKAIAFLPDVGSAKAFSAALNGLGIRSESLDASSKDREIVIDQFRKSYIQVLVNCMLFGEGFDVPDAEAVILLRPTKSRPLYAQMVGRVTRPKGGKKGIIIDFPWVSGKHKLIKPTELFDRTGATDEVYQIAEELLDGMETDDLLEAIEQAEEIQVERRKFRIKSAERKVNYRRVSYDPLAVGDVLGLPMRQESDSALRNRATPKQVELLAKFGIMCGHAMSRRRASKMLDIVFGRMRNGLCTIKQCACLIANDVDPDEARSMSKVDASIRIGQLIGR